MTTSKIIPKIIIAASLAATPLSFAQQVSTFEKSNVGSFIELKSPVGTFTAGKNNAAIYGKKGYESNRSLHISGGKNVELNLTLKDTKHKGAELSFYAERWTRGNPFSFVVEVKEGSKWKKVYDGSKAIGVGNFPTKVNLPINEGVKNIRFRVTSPAKSGALLDNLQLTPASPMVIGETTTVQPVIPTLIRKKINPVMAAVINTKGGLKPKSVNSVTISTNGTTSLEDIEQVQVYHNTSQSMKGMKLLGTADPAKTVTIKGDITLQKGKNYFWACYTLKPTANIDHHTDASITSLTFKGGKTVKPSNPSPEGKQRIGIALRQHGDDGSKAYRIPGLATTNKGTLIGVYDVRYRHGGDLPADIDVGMSRSTDGGQTWEPMKVIMDMGNDPKKKYDGVGDPAGLVDKTNNRIWVGATWSHGNNSWWGSGQGMTPDETGQVILVYSDDDGKTWSKPINITKQVKKKDWHFVLHGPGSGITLKDGTIVFPAQYQDASKKADGKKTAYPFSTIMYSKDKGKTWHIGTGIKGNTTEATVIQLDDGSLMLNCRDNRRGLRTVGVTKDLGKTWEMHPTDRKDLIEPRCMASLLKVDHPKHGKFVLFSNPDSNKSRYNMSIKVSTDDASSWKKTFRYDSRPCSGYSCLAPVKDTHAAVLYEGPTEMYFLRIPYTELLGK